MRFYKTSVKQHNNPERDSLQQGDITLQTKKQNIITKSIPEPVNGKNRSPPTSPSSSKKTYPEGDNSRQPHEKETKIILSPSQHIEGLPCLSPPQDCPNTDLSPAKTAISDLPPLTPTSDSPSPQNTPALLNQPANTSHQEETLASSTLHPECNKVETSDVSYTPISFPLRWDGSNLGNLNPYITSWRQEEERLILTLTDGSEVNVNHYSNSIPLIADELKNWFGMIKIGRHACLINGQKAIISKIVGTETKLHQYLGRTSSLYDIQGAYAFRYALGLTCNYDNALLVRKYSENASLVVSFRETKIDYTNGNHWGSVVPKTAIKKWFNSCPAMVAHTVKRMINKDLLPLFKTTIERTIQRLGPEYSNWTDWIMFRVNQLLATPTDSLTAPPSLVSILRKRKSSRKIVVQKQNKTTLIVPSVKVEDLPETLEADDEIATLISAMTPGEKRRLTTHYSKISQQDKQELVALLREKISLEKSGSLLKSPTREISSKDGKAVAYINLMTPEESDRIAALLGIMPSENKDQLVTVLLSGTTRGFETIRADFNTFSPERKNQLIILLINATIKILSTKPKTGLQKIPAWRHRSLNVSYVRNLLNFPALPPRV